MTLALLAMQQEFQRYILAPLPVEGRPVIADAITGTITDAIADASAGQGSQSGQSGQPGLAPEQRLAIYHRAYRARLREALCACYDKTWSYVGDDMFAELADSYVATHPSLNPNLRWFGAGLAGHAASELPDYPFIAELARFEWALGLAFDAADAAPLGLTDLAALAPEAISAQAFGLHPSVHLLALEWNAVALWQALGSDAPAGTAPPDPEPSAQCWLVWRRGDQPHFRSLAPAEARALRRIGEGATFGAVCHDACDPAHGQADADTLALLAGYLRQWLEQGVLIQR